MLLGRTDERMEGWFYEKNVSKQSSLKFKAILKSVDVCVFTPRGQMASDKEPPRNIDDLHLEVLYHLYSTIWHQISLPRN
jgi:hypothetical protein